MIEETHGDEQIIEIQDVTTMPVRLDELHDLLMESDVVLLALLPSPEHFEVEQVLVAGHTPHLVAP